MEPYFFSSEPQMDGIKEIGIQTETHGAELVGEVVQYGSSYRLCYIRGTEGLLIGLAKELGNK